MSGGLLQCRVMAVQRFTLVLLFLFAAVFRGAAQVQPSARESFDIYLLMGQSNMVGRDTEGMAAQVDNPRVLSLNPEGQWLVARDPLHAKVGRIECGVGPGISFAQEMLKTAPPNKTIGLVPCAVGGTPLKRWVKGGDLYEQAVAKAKLAAKDGIIRGVLWHQGETDTEDPKNAETYEARLTAMLADLRADLGTPDLPVVVGQLGEFLAAQPEKHPHLEPVRTAIQHMPAASPHTGYADSAGLGDKGDKLHFSASAQKEFGTRFAKAMQALQGGTPGITCDLWPEGKMPGQGSRDPEGRASPERTDAIRITNVSRPTLTLFPAPGRETAPAMIVCPGGGYSYVVIDKEGAEIAAWLNSKGISALVLKYRVPNNRGGALQDVQRALSLARAHAGEWKLDPKRLGIIGFSAGGHLAARASTGFGTRSYSPIDEADRQSCRPDFAVLVYPAYLADKQGALSTDLDLTADIPPTLIVHSEDDANFIPGSRAYHKALEDAKKPHEFLLYPTGGHGYGLRSSLEARAWPDAAAAWFEKKGLTTASP